ncbi:hypothetical protein GDO78_013275 [Eleutherodactylus coqui]|uniref:Uncharacterized protein n=1 Tax=Eleutherodactylus coqui TaxID=57060 RepID=A0A8J6EZB4_ELECQ|nr:hypothetical protein GDO78_013275 [Eleutherodactylus coqui]
MKPVNVGTNLLFTFSVLLLTSLFLLADRLRSGTPFGQPKQKSRAATFTEIDDDVYSIVLLQSCSVLCFMSSGKGKNGLIYRRVDLN